MPSRLNVEVIANNIANINTTGFKRARGRVHRPALPGRARGRARRTAAGRTPIPEGAQIGLGVRTAADPQPAHAGRADATPATSSISRSTAAAGSRWRAPTASSFYTRAGAFNKNATGQIVTADGYVVQPAMTIPPNATDVVDQRDRARSTCASAPTRTLQLLGQLTLANFTNEAGLEPLGGNLYRETPASGAPVLGVAGDPGFGTSTRAIWRTPTSIRSRRSPS